MSFSVNLELIHDLWVPNIYIYNLKSFKVIDVLSKLAGLWINNKKEVYYRYYRLIKNMFFSTQTFQRRTLLFGAIEY